MKYNSHKQQETCMHSLIHFNNKNESLKVEAEKSKNL